MNRKDKQNLIKQTMPKLKEGFENAKSNGIINKFSSSKPKNDIPNEYFGLYTKNIKKTRKTWIGIRYDSPDILRVAIKHKNGEWIYWFITTKLSDISSKKKMNKFIMDALL